MDIPNLDNLIDALKCDNWAPRHCQNCPFGYSYLDESGDTSFWTCDEEKKLEDSLFYLSVYQYLIKEQENKV